MRVYISGTMTGVPDLNRPAFDAAAKSLRDKGHFVINPHDLTPIFGTAEEVAQSFDCLYYSEEDSHYSPHSSVIRLSRAVMDAELAAVRSCDAIYLLKGWEESRGAKKELAEALTHGLTVMQEGAEV
ncbi:MAG: DUF4406 domain-containing protein [Kiritimatiellae bacterium]|nr:DUF4406 domain-containing protein [Kiritimatiellia bacterium]